jgi:hypothetical protein
MLGPMVKMTIGGFPLTNLISGYNSCPGSLDGDEPEVNSTSAASSFLNSSNTSGFHMHNLIMN